MYKLFNNILVPLNIDRHCDIAIERAVQLSVQFHCDIHLLYLTSKPFWKTRPHTAEAEHKMKLNVVRDQHMAQMPKGCTLHVSIREGNAAGALMQYIALNNIDLILTHKQQRTFGVFDSRMDINRLAANTGCPVLSLQTNPSLQGIKNIVLPVGDQLPLRKIMLAIYMAKDSNAAIHLISLSNNTAAQKRYVYLEKAYQLLRENTSLPIKCKMVMGENIADTTLEYARNVEADLILVKAGDESLLSGPMNRLFSKFLFNRSTIPVITVA